MKKISLFLVLCLLACCFSASPALAAEDAAEPEFNGYLIRLTEAARTSVSLLSDDGLDEIYAPAGLYACDGVATLLDCLDSGAVEYFEPNYTVTLLSNDQYYSEQWNLSAINAEAAWNSPYDGAGVRVGLIDSGLNASHLDLDSANIAEGWNFKNDTANISDTYGHGTRVAGIIAAVRDNGLCVAGMTQGCTIVPLKCFDEAGTDIGYVIKAVYAAVDKFDCDVINLSLGLTQRVASFESALDYASGKGAILVAAAGNSGTRAMYYPAAYDCVIGVGSVGLDLSVSTFSQRNESVMVVAPGGENYSDKDSSNDEVIYSLSAFDNDGVEGGMGTSFASPHVAALAAIAKSYDSAIDTEMFKELLIQSSKDLGPVGYDTYYGYGLIDVQAFIAEMTTEDPEPLPDPDPDPEPSQFGDVSGNWAESEINYCAENKLFSGVTATAFDPYGSMSRAMFVQVLSNLNGEDISGYTNSFSDVPAGAWFYGSVSWGAAKNIVNGLGETSFGPYVLVNREQMAVFLFRYAKACGYTDGSYDDTVLSSFADGASISSWAVDAVSWAAANGILQGKTGGSFDPSGTATRAEAAAIIARFHKMISA